MKRNKWWRMSWMLLSLLMVFSSVVPAFTVYAEEDPAVEQEETVAAEEDAEEGKEVIAWEDISGENTTEDVVTEEKQAGNATSVWITKADGTTMELKAGNTEYVFDDVEGNKVTFTPETRRLTIEEGYQSLVGLGHEFDTYNHCYAKIYANGNLDIFLKGENIALYAVPTEAEKSLTVKESYGIFADGDILFYDQTADDVGGGSITVKSADVATEKSAGISCQTYSQNRYLNDSIVKVYTYGFVSNSFAKTSVGLEYSNNLRLGDTGFNNAVPEDLVLEAYGGNIDSSVYGFSYGVTNITVPSSPEVTNIICGATLKAVGGNTIGYSYGFGWEGKSMDIYGSTVFAKSGNAGSNSDSYGAYIAYTDYAWIQNYKDKPFGGSDIKSEVVFEGVAEGGNIYGAYISNEDDYDDITFGLKNSSAGTITLKSSKRALHGNLTATSVFADKTDPEGSNAKLAINDDGVFSDYSAKYVYATGSKYTEALDKYYFEKNTNKDITIDLKDLFDQVYAVEGNLSVGNGNDLVYITGGTEHKGGEANFASNWFYPELSYAQKELVLKLKPATVQDGDTIKIPVILNGKNCKRTWNITVEMMAGEPVEAVVTQESITYGEELPYPVVTIKGTINAFAEGFTYKGVTYNGTAYDSNNKPSDPGTYTVYYKETKNSETYYGQADFTIAKKDLSAAVISFAEEQNVYDGTEKYVKVLNVTVDDRNLGNLDYKITSGAKATNVQDQYLVIEGTGKYTGTCTSTGTWSLKKATPDETLVNFTNGKQYQYDGKPKKAEVTVKPGITGLGDLIIWYKQNNVNDNNAPTAVGTYNVLLYFAEGSNYAAIKTPVVLGTMRIIPGTGFADIIGEPMVKTSGEIDLKDYVKNNTGVLSFEISGGTAAAGCTINGSKFKAGTTPGDVTVTISIAASDSYNARDIDMELTVVSKDVKSFAVSMKDFRVDADPKPEPEYQLPSGATDVDRKYNGILLADGSSYSSHILPTEAGTYSVTVTCQTADAVYSGSASFKILSTAVSFVTFDLKGKGENFTATVDDGEKAVKPADPKADDFAFGGWFTDQDCKNAYDFNDVVEADITLYSKWIPLCTVSFNMCGQGTAIDIQKVEPGKTATKPADPAADGYVFGGWFTDEECTKAFDFATAITADITLYAKWTKLYSVSFNMLGHGTQIDLQKVEEGKTVTKPADPTADGYDFAGWFKEEACINAYDFATPVTADITLYANWELSAAPMNPIPEIKADTKDLHLVKGQSFTLPEGKWTSDQPKVVKITKKGAFLSAKKVTETGKPATITNETTKQAIKVYVTLPAYAKKKVTFNAGDRNKSLGFSYDKKNLAIQWATSAPDVATVSENGAVNAIAKGKATITAYINGKAYSCTVNVKEDTAVAERTLHLNLKASKKLSIKGVKAAKAEWTVSSNGADIVEVTKGKFKAKEKAGTTTVTCKTTDGKTYKIKVIVEDIAIKTGKIEAAGKNKYKVSFDKAGEKARIEFNSVMQPVTFKSSAGAKAYVDRDGNIVANGKGKASLKAKINGKTVSISVKVNN